jgi:hypothetical protein
VIRNPFDIFECIRIKGNLVILTTDVVSLKIQNRNFLGICAN